MGSSGSRSECTVFTVTIRVASDSHEHVTEVTDGISPLPAHVQGGSNMTGTDCV
jgi:hypothetical protein